MTVKLKPLSEQVIVITGASSGIGLATAWMASQQGAKVVLSSRTQGALDDVVRDIEAKGGEALAVAGDVGVMQDMERLADEAMRRFGRIDTWVNNAGVGIWGRIEEVSLDDMRRLMDTNFWGMVHGSLAALTHLKRDGGALVNVGSMVSDRAVPIQGIYSASKYAVKGFTEALRMEIEETGAPVSVTLVKPGSIGTPMPQHVKNYTGREAKFPPPVYAPESVAKVILHAATRPVRDAFVGSAARTISAMARLAPRLLDLASERFAIPLQLGPQAPTPSDNLWHGNSDGQVRGDAQGSTIRPSLSSDPAVRPYVMAAVAGAALVGTAYLMRRRTPRPHRTREGVVPVRMITARTHGSHASEG